MTFPAEQQAEGVCLAGGSEPGDRRWGTASVAVFISPVANVIWPAAGKWVALSGIWALTGPGCWTPAPPHRGAPAGTTL